MDKVGSQRVWLSALLGRLMTIIRYHMIVERQLLCVNSVNVTKYFRQLSFLRSAITGRPDAARACFARGNAARLATGRAARAISRAETQAEYFRQIISRRGASKLSPPASIAPLNCQRRDPNQASGSPRRRSTPGRHHLVTGGDIIS
jgi:hypothetical protein